MKAADVVPQGLPVAAGIPIEGEGSMYPTPPPPAPVAPAAPALPPVDPGALRELGWPNGLTHMVASSIPSMPIRFVIVDNSGSMQSMDGSRLVPGAGGKLQAIKSTRWAELGQSIKDLAAVAQAVRGPTHFHFLNPCPYGQFFGVACEFAPPGGIAASIGSPDGDHMKLQQATSSSPGGTTPLTEALMRVDGMIRPYIGILRSQGQKAAVIITTDGLPNDPASFLRALQGLQSLPVWVVVRLCTSDDSVVEYWSGLDAQLEMSLETLDDLESEAKECFAKNPWLAYGPALHMARTFGLQDRTFDLLDEKALLPSQAKEFIEKLLGCPGLPEPEVDPKGFQKVLEQQLKAQLPVYNPVTKKMTPWVDTKKLIKGGCVIS